MPRAAVQLGQERLLPYRHVHQVVFRGPSCGIANLRQLALAQALHRLVERRPGVVEASERSGGRITGGGHGVPPSAAYDTARRRP